MRATTKKWIKNLLRWGIAVFGVGWVVSNMSWYDRVLINGPDDWPVAVRLASPAEETDATFSVIKPKQSEPISLPRKLLLLRADNIQIRVGNEVYDVLAQKVGLGGDRSDWPYLVAHPRNLVAYFDMHLSTPKYIMPEEIIGPRPSGVPYPLIDRGIGPMLHQARTSLLLASIFVFPIVFLIVAYRWHQLLKALDIRMTLARTFAISMVGAFYNTFMPGSTGGDLLKAYYASRLTPHRTRAVMSVIVDRALGLLALVILGGFMASVGFFTMAQGDPARQKCGQIAVGSGLIIVGMSGALLIFYIPRLRAATGLGWIMNRLPMQRQVQAAIETMEIYRRRPFLVLWAIIVTFPVHATVVISATFAGMAFGLPLNALYYWVVVPVVVLAGSIPISPQGAGVMEFFAIVLTKRQGCTISQAFALTMSIRLVQILWNLTGGIFVLRGGFHTPTDAEKQTLEEDLPETGPDPAPS